MMFAQRVELTPDQVTSLVHGGPHDPCWTSERERPLISAVDAPHETTDIDDGLRAGLAQVFDEHQLLDVGPVAGQVLAAGERPCLGLRGRPRCEVLLGAALGTLVCPVAVMNASDRASSERSRSLR